MNRSSKYFPLEYIVECKPGRQPFFEVIAAFNADCVANHYANECRVANPGNEYRVLTRRGRKFQQTYTA